jgi:hypothetical protein
VHRHEEDAGERMVFVRAGAPLPPSRGRRRLELRARGRLAASAPGPADRPEAARGRWRVDDSGRLELAFRAGEREEVEAFRIESVDEDRLVLVRVP